MAIPSDMAKHGVGGLPPALIRRIAGLLEMDEDAVLWRCWGRPSIEGRKGPFNDQPGPQKVCHDGTI